MLVPKFENTPFWRILDDKNTPISTEIVYFEFQYNDLISSKCDLFKGLRPVLEGFVVPMHEGACETGSQIPRA